MKELKLKEAPASVRWFVSLILCVIGLSYLTMLAGIWFDTNMKIALIMEGYGTFEAMELARHSHEYLFWFLFHFIAVMTIFFFTSYSEKIKKFFAVFVPVFIVSDIGSMWLIPFVSKGFAWQLFISGLVLAFFFLTMFLLIYYDIWFKKSGQR